MRRDNKLYKNQGIHVISSIFTVEDGITKVLLIKRASEPYKDKWALVGGALYNNETLLDGVKREIKEKVNIDDVELYQTGVYDEFGKTDDIGMRMVSINYLGIVDVKKTNVVKETRNTSNAFWFDIRKVPYLAFGHNDILNESLEKLKELVIHTNILKSLLPKEFTMPNLQNLFEQVLEEKFDRRNFRKKILSLNIVEDTKKEKSIDGKKPAKLYRFKEKIENKKVL